MKEQNDTLQRLIWPLDVNIFFAEYWERRPLIVSREERNYFSHLLSLRDIDKLFWNMKPEWGMIRLANNHRSEDWVDYTRQAPEVITLIKAYNQGDTLVFNDIHTRWQPLAFLARTLEETFNFHININAYLTPRGSQGLPAHYDSQDVFILQLEGTKLWRLYESSPPLPLEEDYQEISDPILNHETLLRAGDLLYIPRGAIHEAMTSEDPSLHATVTINVLRWANLVSTALSIALQSEARNNIKLRRALPIDWLRNIDAFDAQDEVLKIVKNIIGNLDAERALSRLAGELIQQLPSLPDNYFCITDDHTDLSLTSQVRKRPGMLCQIIENEDSVSIYFPGNIVSCPLQAKPALDFALTSSSFCIRSLPGNLNDASKILLVRRLIEEGLLAVITNE